jgi:dolichyl-phosphate beta-glucosyltransferase
MSADFISIIVPSYNEGERIQPTLEKVVEYLRPRFSRFEVIVVDDGSADDTSNKVTQAQLREPRVKLISCSANHGKGFAVRQGILAAKGDAVLFTDADLSTPVETIESGLKGLDDGYPVVIASRRHAESIIVLRQSWSRDFIGRIFNLVVRRLLSLRFQDTQCGFKCFSREAARKIFSVARIDGFAFDAEILVIARTLGYRVKEIPVCWTNSPESKVRPLRNFLRVSNELLKIRRNDSRGLYFKCSSGGDVPPSNLPA